MKKAFTLIELLVVVLIIGILSAIALPQYEKAVEKARAAEILSNVNALSKTAEMYFLSGRTDRINVHDLEIELSGGQYDPIGDDNYVTKIAKYQFVCIDGTTCWVESYRENCFTGGELDTDNCDTSHNWSIHRDWENGQITENRCVTQLTSTGRTICKSLEGQGFEYDDGEM